MKERQIIPALILAVSLGIAPKAAMSQADTRRFSPECYTNEIPDTIKCFHEILLSPYRDIILSRNGYYDGFGLKQSILPDRSLNNFNAGMYITGNLLYLDDDLSTNEINSQSEELGITNPEQFIGGLATDSCYYKINHFAAWIRPKGSKEPFRGRFLIIDCASSFDKIGRNIVYQSVGEINKTQFDRLPTTNGLAPIEILFQLIEDTTIPDPNMDVATAVDYPTAWKQELDR